MQVICCFGDSVRELNGKAVECRRPVSHRLGPLLGDVPDRQVEQLVQRVSVGKQVTVSADLAKRAVERLDGVGGVDDLADVVGVVEERDYVFPVGFPAPADGWKALVVALAELAQRLLGRFGDGSLLDVLEFARDLLLLLPAHELEAVGDAALVPDLGDESVEVALVLGDQSGLELAVAVSGHLDLHLALVAAQLLGAVAVAGVGGPRLGSLTVLLVAQMGSKLEVEHLVDQPPLELGSKDPRDRESPRGCRILREAGRAAPP